MVEKERLIAMVQRLQQGDQEAATQVYETFQSDIYYFILKTVNNDRELAEDLTQDTFLEILETVGKLQEPAAFVTWSKQIAYHRCTAYFRKRQEILLDEAEDGYSAFDTVEEDREEFLPDAALDHEDLKNTILGMINALPQDQKSAILLRYFNELPVKEIAQIQGVTEGTVKSRLNYGRKAVKQAVEDYEKKNDIKLHSVGILPLLLWVFKGYRVEHGLAISSNTAAQSIVFGNGAAGVAAAMGFSAAASATAVAAAGGKVLAAKIVAGVMAAAVAVGGISLAVSSAGNTRPVESAPTTAVTTEATAISTETVETHIHTVTVTDIAATCTEDGLYREVCQDCGEVMEETVIPATGHPEYVETERVNPKPGVSGHVTYTCVACDDTYTEILTVPNRQADPAEPSATTERKGAGASDDCFF